MKKNIAITECGRCCNLCGATGMNTKQAEDHDCKKRKNKKRLALKK